jgi:hypothetical protein
MGYPHGDLKAILLDETARTLRDKGDEQIMRDYVKAYVNFAVSNSEYYDLM